MSMDIYSKPGTKVVFTGLNGGEIEQASARKKLVIGKSYTVKRTEIEGWYTDVYLNEVEGSFNSVLFIEEEKYKKENK